LLEIGHLLNELFPDVLSPSDSLCAQSNRSSSTAVRSNPHDVAAHVIHSGFLSEMRALLDALRSCSAPHDLSFDAWSAFLKILEFISFFTTDPIVAEELARIPLPDLCAFLLEKLSIMDLSLPTHDQLLGLIVSVELVSHARQVCSVPLSSASFSHSIS
jgi:hypothetical protein